MKKRCLHCLSLAVIVLGFSNPTLIGQDDDRNSETNRKTFVGTWNIGKPNVGGGSSFIMTLFENGTARKSHVPSSRGKWKLVKGQAYVTWSDGWRDIIRKDGERFTKIAFAPGSQFDGKIDNTASATKQKPLPKIELRVGWSRADITPDRSVGLIGFGRRRISEGTKDPITATVLVIEGVNADGKIVDQAIMISCDLISLRRVTLNAVREELKNKIPEFESDKLIMNATHTHQAPQQQSGSSRGIYDFSEEEKSKGWMSGDEYRHFMVDRISKAVTVAWRSRKPNGVSWALDQAVIGFNRRIVLKDGKAQMSRNTNRPSFDHIEGIEDHSLSLLFFWDANEKLTGVIINVANPAQSEQGGNMISADYWHDVREEIKKRFSQDVFVLPQCAAAGECMPLSGIHQKARELMAQRKGTSWRREIARRIVDGVERSLPTASKHIAKHLEFNHTVSRINLPEKQPPSRPFVVLDSVKPVELHLLRIGEIGMATAPFELFIDHGMQIQARSKAILTFTVQLCCGHSEYLPSKRAIAGGGYSAEKYLVGPEGGAILVNECIKQLNRFWP